MGAVGVPAFAVVEGQWPCVCWDLLVTRYVGVLVVRLLWDVFVVFCIPVGSG
jgi:hypothetical protein